MGPSTLQCMSCQGSLGPTSGGVDLALEFLAGRQSKEPGQEAGQEAAPEVAQVVGLQGGEEIVFGTVVAAAGEVQAAHIGDLDTSVSHRLLAK